MLTNISFSECKCIALILIIPSHCENSVLAGMIAQPVAYVK